MYEDGCELVKSSEWFFHMAGWLSCMSMRLWLFYSIDLHGGWLALGHQIWPANCQGDEEESDREEG